MTKCTSCKKERILEVTAKCSDMCVVSIDGREKDGYVPKLLGIGGDDYIELKLCLDCGKVQSKDFPVKQKILDTLFNPFDEFQ